MARAPRVGFRFGFGFAATRGRGVPPAHSCACAFLKPAGRRAGGEPERGRPTSCPTAPRASPAGPALAAVTAGRGGVTHGMHLPVPDHVRIGARGASPGRGALRPHTPPRPSGPQLPTVARGCTDGPGAELGLAGRATSTGLPAEGALRDRHWHCLRNGGDRTRRPLHSRALLPPAPGFN